MATTPELAPLTAEEFSRAVANCQPVIAEASKLLLLEPAVLTYFGLIDVQPINNPKVTLRLSTKGTGAGACLQYNPAWLTRISGHPSILAFCFYSETLRLALHHCTTRKCMPVECFKLASDLICFEDQRLLSKHQKAVQDMIATIPKQSDVAHILTKNKFNKSTDWFLEKLNAIFRKELQEQQKQAQGGQGQGQQPDQSQGQNGQGQGQGQPGQGQANGQGQGQSQGQQDNLRGNSLGQGNGDVGDAMDEYFKASRENAETATAEWEENSALDEEVAEVTKHIASDNSQWGNLSGGMIQSILAANTPKFDPTIVLRRFKANVMSENVYDTRLKANRRHGFELPGYRHQMKCKILFAMDCSGSMSDEDIALGEGLVNKFVKHAETWHAFWDGECGPFFQDKKKANEFKLVGRGCTNPQCVIDRIIKEKEKFDGIIIFSDCQFCWEKPEKYANKIFVITVDEKAPDWCKYHLDMEEVKRVLGMDK